MQESITQEEWKKRVKEWKKQHAGMDIETKEFADTSIQDVLLLFENKRVRVTIEEILEEVPSGRSPTYDERGMPKK